MLLKRISQCPLIMWLDEFQNTRSASVSSFFCRFSFFFPFPFVSVLWRQLAVCVCLWVLLIRSLLYTNKWAGLESVNKGLVAVPFESAQSERLDDVWYQRWNDMKGQTRFILFSSVWTLICWPDLLIQTCFGEVLSFLGTDLLCFLFLLKNRHLK